MKYLVLYQSINCNFWLWLLRFARTINILVYDDDGNDDICWNVRFKYLLNSDTWLSILMMLLTKNYQSIQIPKTTHQYYILAHSIPPQSILATQNDTWHDLKYKIQIKGLRLFQTHLWPLLTTQRSVPTWSEYLMISTWNIEGRYDENGTQQGGNFI